MSHIHEKIDFTSSAYIVHESTVLLRMHDKYNIWLPVGGHIELDEDPLQSLFREVKEECGLEVELIGKEPEKFTDDGIDLPAPNFLLRIPTGGGHEHIDLAYVVRAKNLEIKPGAQEKEVEFHWFNLQELEMEKFKVPKHVQYYAKEAIKVASSNP